MERKKIPIGANSDYIITVKVKAYRENKSLSLPGLLAQNYMALLFFGWEGNST